MFFKLQYLHRVSTQIEKKIRDFLKRYEIRLVMSHSTFNIGKLFPYKDRQSLLHSVGVLHTKISYSVFHTKIANIS